MPSYRCKYMTPDGNYVKKTIAADSRDDLQWRLEKDGHFVYRIRREDRLRLPLGGEPRSKKFKIRDFFSFNKEFAVLIRTGMPIVGALDAIIEKSEPSELNNILQQVRYDVSTGESLSDAFAKYPRIFSNLYISSLQAGEKSGNIPEALIKHVAYLKQMMALRRKLISASVYPLILVAASVAVLFLLLIYVVPAFTKTYFESGTQLPAITMVLINVSNGIKNNFIYLVLLAILITAGWAHAARQETMRIHMDQWLLKIPYLGRLYISYATALFLRTVAMVLTAGAPLIESVRIASGTLNNLFLRNKLIQVVRRITEGLGFSEALDETEAFPHLAIRMIAAGESGGELEQVLLDAADFYDDEVDVKLTVISSTIEPALMIIMGLLIGFIVLAMYMPIFQLAGTIN
ncbi:MAG: type II secretion system F family protein [Deltaproteobacteria bacterium]|nr:type II secretion system F family protein [Deltaproteobacteria bacterium]